MKFEEALAAMRQSKMFRRSTLTSGAYYCIHRGQLCYAAGPCMAANPVSLPSDILLAEDWEVVPPPAPKLYPFSVALEMARQDPTVRIGRQQWVPELRLEVAFDGRMRVAASARHRLAFHQVLDGDDVMARDWVIER